MKQQTTNKDILRLFWGHAWKHKKYLLATILFAVLFILFYHYLPPLIVSQILNKITANDFVKGDVYGSFGPLLIAYAICIIVGGTIFGRILNYFHWNLEMKVLYDLHNRIFNNLLEQSTNFHANRFGGSLVSQANKLAGSYERIADTLLKQVFSLLLSFIFSITILYPKNPGIALFLLGFSIVFILISILMTKKVRLLNAVWARKQTQQTGYLADAISNVIAVKSFAHLKFETKRFKRATQESRDAQNDVLKKNLSRESFFATSNGFLIIGSLILAVSGVVNKGQEVASIFLVFSYVALIADNLWVFSNHSLRSINQALGDAYEMTTILNTKPSIKDPVSPEKLAISDGKIEFKDVTFTHTDNNDALFNKLNIQISPGEKIGLVGHSGSGKTTITSLVLRFNDLDSGSILIDGQDISCITQSDLRSKITYVPQEPLMFHRTIAENIAYGRPDATKEQIEAIAKMANAHEFIKGLPGGYETLVGERGVKLSGGQRQRVAIARAMIKEAPILVLDEATSALDSESEVLIQDALWKLMEGRTAIVIAHRLSTIQKMDRIIVLGNGNIIEQGSHTELLKDKGKYAELWAHQSGGFIED